MAKKHKEKKSHDNRSALFIPAGVILGMWLGFLFDNLVAGMFIGLGAGMVTLAILMFLKK